MISKASAVINPADALKEMFKGHSLDDISFSQAAAYLEEQVVMKSLNNYNFAGGYFYTEPSQEIKAMVIAAEQLRDAASL